LSAARYVTKTYSQTGLCETCGTVWNLSRTGWRFSGSLPLRIGEVCSLSVNLPSHQPIYVAAGMVRWVRGEEFGVETLVIDDESREELEDYLWQRLEESADNIPRTTCALDANACRSTRGPCLARERRRTGRMMCAVPGAVLLSKTASLWITIGFLPESDAACPQQLFGPLKCQKSIGTLDVILYCEPATTRYWGSDSRHTMPKN